MAHYQTPKKDKFLSTLYDEIILEFPATNRDDFNNFKHDRSYDSIVLNDTWCNWQRDDTLPDWKIINTISFSETSEKVAWLGALRGSRYFFAVGTEFNEPLQ